MGPHPDSKAEAEGHYTYTLVYRGGSHLDRIYVDTGEDGIRRFRFGSPLPVEPSGSSNNSAAPTGDARRPKGLPSPASPCPFPRPQYDDPSYFFFYSSADMHGVSEVTLYRTDQGNIGGMVLRYHDERQVSLGQVRPDRLVEGPEGGPTIRVEDPVRTPLLWFRLAFLSRSPLFEIEAITLGPVERQCPGWSDGTTWFSVPWRGTLEWWFDWDTCQLVHDGRSSSP